LKEGFQVGKTVYFVATDAVLFSAQIPKMIEQLKMLLSAEK